MKRYLLSLALTALTFVQASAREDLSASARTLPGAAALRGAANCSPSTSRVFLDINNVRALILAGGDYWWDQGSSGLPRYEIPKVTDPTQPRINSLFAGAVWIGGYTSGTLRVAAQTYRQSTVLGIGYWPGPLNVNNATTTASNCLTFDKHWKVDRSMVETHRANTIIAPGGQTSLAPGYVPPQVFLDWPANGDLSQGQAPTLAPFVNVGGDPNVYEPALGDYPRINGDQSIWTVINDRGNVSGSGASQIGMEIQTQSFAYASNDELNNMTFYFHTIINRSTLRLDSCFMAQWVDPDLGNAADDFVGCDVPRGLGICYNGDNNDEGIQGYGDNPPSVGCDFFEGPFSDSNDGLDNDRDGRVDEIDTFVCDGVGKTERCIMTKFLYFNNDASPIGNPSTAVHAYNYMTGFWKDGNRMVYGGNGYPGSTGSTVFEADMMFPGASDFQYGWSIGGTAQNPRTIPFAWTELFPGPGAAANAPADRRFVQSGGPFTLEPGAVNYITIGIVWARASSGGATGSFNQLLRADSKAQALFDNCFQTLNGPDAPDMTITEMDRQLIFTLTYKPSSNNFGLKYKEVDPIIKAVYGFNPTPAQLDSASYKFQGFIVYQLSGPNVSTGELRDASRARIVFQCDIKDGVNRLINYYIDPDLEKPIPRIEVDGSDQGVQTTFRLNRDAFATGNDILINHKKYYYMAVAYSYNNYKDYNPITLEGQAVPFFAGRNNISVYTGVPHINTPEKDGLVLNSTYGDAPIVRRVEGTGNGYQLLDLSDSTISEILASPDHRALFPVYKPGFGPVNVKIVDPKLVIPGKHWLRLYNPGNPTVDTISNNSRWMLILNPGTSNQDTVFSDTTISTNSEQVVGMYELTSTFKSYGLSVTVLNAVDPGLAPDDNRNGVLFSDFSFADNTNQWLQFLGDSPNFDWILTGPDGAGTGALSGDDKNYFSGILNGTWSAMRFVRRSSQDPTLTSLLPSFPAPLSQTDLTLGDIPSVKIVFTPNKANWSRGWVLEMGSDPLNSEGGQTKGRVRLGRSVDKEGNPVSDPNDVGLGWFPGYAINMETGERLNICFGEASEFASDRGKDMLWNPTSTIFDNRTGTLPIGGRHYLYVMKSRYDEGAFLKRFLFASAGSGAPFSGTQGSAVVKQLYNNVAWVSIPFATPGQQILTTDLTVNLRVAKRYTAFATQTPALNNNNPLYEINTTPFAPKTFDRPTAVRALDIIRVVPNPFYSVSGYENSQIDNRVKITNLPRRCTVSIFTSSGALVRVLTKDDESTSIDWDLLNSKRVPIASGAYIFHVNAPGIGEKTVKWFGVVRPIDLDTF